jgi:hypothetical protein
MPKPRKHGLAFRKKRSAARRELRPLHATIVAGREPLYICAALEPDQRSGDGHATHLEFHTQAFLVRKTIERADRCGDAQQQHIIEFQVKPREQLGRCIEPVAPQKSNNLLRRHLTIPSRRGRPTASSVTKR